MLSDEQRYRWKLLLDCTKTSFRNEGGMRIYKAECDTLQAVEAHVHLLESMVRQAATDFSHALGCSGAVSGDYPCKCGFAEFRELAKLMVPEPNEGLR